MGFLEHHGRDGHATRRGRRLAAAALAAPVLLHVVCPLRSPTAQRDATLALAAAAAAAAA
eukprot:CAMPEP_0115328422 /NCGR_PEP_ID=MMETSP0270-20121206/84673_1 /TAXON_ID=71861 /ORGANISM="Scrippsiella trochoidea, Strain CCMP3099" /LENGTH=59 /DNA_ID=CAMNT_0002748945 /DNA_START=647 /DNA_END=824 /DNA_ORIENTATION=-